MLFRNPGPYAARVTGRAGRARLALVACALPLALLTACSKGGGADARADGPDSSPAILQPGAPGEPTTTLDPEDASVAPPEWSHADAAFAQMMIPHHGQALEMARLAQKRADDPAVKQLAARIEAAQGPEILALGAWLEDRGLEVPTVDDDPGDYDHGDHGHGAMTGMLTPKQLTALASARGAEFDRLFLAGMIQHHEGALAMVEDVAAEGTDTAISEMAADIQAGQSAEIARMQEMLG